MKSISNNFPSHALMLFSAILLTACVTPKPPLKPHNNTISYGLKIEHIFTPPSNEYHPYSLLHYGEKSGYTMLCGADVLSDIPEENLTSELKESRIANTNLASGSISKFGINLTKADVGSAGIDYANIKFLQISLTNGKKITMPSMRMYIAKENLQKSRCKEEIRIYSQANKESQYFIPNSMYKYTIKSTILDQDGLDITAKVPPTLQRIIFAKAGIQFAGTASMQVSGENLYIGFNGLSVTDSFFAIESKGLKPKNIVLNVTDLINKIRNEK